MEIFSKKLNPMYKASRSITNMINSKISYLEMVSGGYKCDESWCNGLSSDHVEYCDDGCVIGWGGGDCCTTAKDVTISNTK